MVILEDLAEAAWVIILVVEVQEISPQYHQVRVIMEEMEGLVHSMVVPVEEVLAAVVVPLQQILVAVVVMV
jgi:hypothetical protein